MMSDRPEWSSSVTTTLTGQVRCGGRRSAAKDVIGTTASLPNGSAWCVRSAGPLDPIGRRWLRRSSRAGRAMKRLRGDGFDRPWFALLAYRGGCVFSFGPNVMVIRRILTILASLLVTSQALA
jgi:hypothetical protein